MNRPGEGRLKVDLDDCAVAPAVGTPDTVRLAGSVALAEVGGVVAFCGMCAVTWLVVTMMLPRGYLFLLLALVIVGKRELPLGGLARACGRGGWSPWEGSGAR